MRRDVDEARTERACLSFKEGARRFEHLFGSELGGATVVIRVAHAPVQPEGWCALMNRSSASRTTCVLWIGFEEGRRLSIGSVAGTNKWAGFDVSDPSLTSSQREGFEFLWADPPV